MTKTLTLTVGKRVYAGTRNRGSNGKIVAIHETPRGPWYEINPTGGGANFKVRAACISNPVY